ncbi:MAG: GHKL domain-containing protein [Bacteroidales bacterium]|nr:GHKL domain-containing protein [Bacteroidales bacterium]
MHTIPDKRYFVRFLLILAAILVTWITGDYIFNNYHYGAGYHRKLQKQLLRKFEEIDRHYELVKSNNWELSTPIPSDRGIVIIAYCEDSLVYWSDNSITFNSFKSDVPEQKRFDSISNGWYVIKAYRNDSIRTYGLYLVKNEYPYENEFLMNNFHKDLKLPRSTELLTKSTEGTYSIHDWEGIYLFSVRFDKDELRFAQIEKYFSPVMLFVFFISILLLTDRILKIFIRGRNRNLALLMFLLIFVMIRWLQCHYRFPADIYELELFGPVPFAHSSLLPSLGDVFINAILLFYFGLKFSQDYKCTGSLYDYKHEQPVYSVISGFILGIAFVFIYTHYVLSNLIIHSTISFEISNVASLNVYTFLSLLIMAMHFVTLVFMCDKFFRLCKDSCSIQPILGIFLIISASLFLILLLTPYTFELWSCIAFVLLFVIIAFIHYKGIPSYNYTQLVLVIIFFSVYSVVFISYYTKEKTGNNMKILAEKLAEQHDPVAEYLLEDIYDQLLEDETLFRFLYDRNVPYEEITNYLQKSYFNGYWSKYNLIPAECRPYDTLEIGIGSTTRKYNCYEYYDNLIENGGMKLGEMDFYYLDILDGQIHYLGKIPWTSPDSEIEGVFYLELESRLIAEEVGYPELLLDKKYQETGLYQEYSYAKYYRNQLLARSGDFQYSLNLNTYELDSATTDSLLSSPDNLEYVKFDGFGHYIYRFANENVIMISQPVINFFDQLISFSYIFLFYFMLVIISMGFRYFSRYRTGMSLNFKNKIRLAIISILLLSLLMVGGGTIYLSIEQYKTTRYNNLSEKIQSVYLELDNMLANMGVLEPDWQGYGYDNLNQYLISLSDVFYTDINLYDPEGNMLATSRAEIFNQGIIGGKMDPLAYNKMVMEKQPEFIHQENIGALEFLSAYVPFVNTENSLLAFLNLPYFTKENEQRNETTTLIVAMVNVFVLLLLLTFIVTIFISNQIVLPLKLIQQKFGEIKLGKMSEEISYEKRDEIAGLVNEYNRMVRELVKSVEKLSRSERESAWREMAKQIAHEIKNPLTPMKLSVQHLQRTWKDNKENFDEYLEKFTKTLIEQIDNLSFIASEFSNFAKMPKASSTNISLVKAIRSALSLFSNTENVDIEFQPEKDDVRVYADQEQLARAFINLIKNAIQAIPENQKGRIEIKMEVKGSTAIVSIKDNGKGMSEEIQQKLFTHSFTTKSSGMGLGLSITKNIIESFQGNITFKTEVNVGTTFIVELPVYLDGRGDDLK